MRSLRDGVSTILVPSCSARGNYCAPTCVPGMPFSLSAPIGKLATLPPQVSSTVFCGAAAASMLASFLHRSAHVSTQQTCRPVPLSQQQPLRRVAARSGATSDAVSDEEAQRFEKIAAALVEKLKDLPDTEEEPLGECY